MKFLLFYICYLVEKKFKINWSRKFVMWILDLMKKEGGGE